MINQFSILLIFITVITSACTPSGEQFHSPLNENPSEIRNGKMIQVSSYDTTGGNNDRINIHPGESAEIFNVAGPGVITRIWITIDSRDPHFLRRIVLKMYWDNEEDPSVEVPIGDFFGSGFEYIHHTPKFIGMSSGGYYSYFPMPFNKNARIEVLNETGQEVFAFYYQVNFYQMEDSWPGNTGYFHSQWRRDVRTDYEDNFTLLEAKGRGQFVGMNFSGQPYNGSLFYLEGDEMIYVDDETVPSTHGTGLEDYFTSGWYFKNGTFSADYHGLVLKDDKTGRVTAYRHHIPDAIPFRKNIRVTYEHGHGNEQIADFAGTAYWYQVEPHETSGQFPKAGLRIPLQRPVPNGSLEVEELILTTSLKSEVIDMTDFGSDWSGGSQLRVYSDSNEKNFSISIPRLLEKAYSAKLYFSSGSKNGEIVISANQKYLDKINTYSEEIGLPEPVILHDLEPENDTLRIDFQISGENSIAEIDAIHLSPIKNYIPEWYMIGPFPNPRKSDYERFGLDSIYPPEMEINLNASYTGVDGQEVNWFLKNGRPGGYDMALWNDFSPYEFIVTYALSYIYSPVEQTVPMFLGTDDGAKVFLNDEQIYRFLQVRIAAPDQEKLDLNLKPGWNKILLKLENNFGGYAFYCRVVDVNENLKFKAKIE